MSEQNSWDTINARRCDLIYKSVYSAITTEESEELERLQQLADDRVRALAPLPIKELEAYMRNKGIDVPDASSAGAGEVRRKVTPTQNHFSDAAKMVADEEGQ